MPPKLTVSNPNPVCLIGGASISKTEILAVSALVDAYIAVDSGADQLLAAGLEPQVVIGDLDSLSDIARATFADRLCHIPEQSTTDFEKALSRVAAPVVIALGFTGGRLDHTLSVLSVMLQYPERPVVLADANDVSFLARSGRTTVALPKGTRVSVMPLMAATVTLEGVEWPFADRLMTPDGYTSPSNAASGEGPVTLTTDGPVLVILPRPFLERALKAAARAQ